MQYASIEAFLQRINSFLFYVTGLIRISLAYIRPRLRALFRTPREICSIVELDV